ncbi:tetratricopeptide repeat protein [Ruegeria arenilitoris]|uniref:tetratricopeptide repeat protein n=1 Tax=Ruegeria arenilitoris TaxID=1173585 RepID=UPI001479F0BE|nr:hypothetical protein [Ruegeria arenilitoris]
MNGRIVRLAAACLIFVTAFLLYQNKQHSDLVADMLAADCHSPDAEPDKTIQGCSRLLENAKYTPEELAVIQIYRGRAYIVKKDLQRALTEFKAAATLNAEEHQAWQWVSHVLGKLGDDEAAFDAIEKAHQLAPTITYTAKQRFRLLKKLERYEEADAYFSQLMEEYPVAENERLLWMPRRLGRMRLEREQYGAAAEAFREALRVDLTHEKTRQQFFEACMLAGSNCPPLFPERRENYPVLTCEEAIVKLGEHYPKFVESTVSEAGFETLEDFFEQGGLPARMILQAIYLGTASEVLTDFPSSEAARFLVDNRVFDCVNGGLFHYPRGSVEDEELKLANENLLSPQMRRNLVDLAQAALN